MPNSLIAPPTATIDAVGATLIQDISTVMAMFDIPDDAGIRLLGSLAEGLGNELSDVDILVISDDIAIKNSIPRELAHFGRRRFEIFTQSTNDLIQLYSIINSSGPSQHNHSIIKIYHEISVSLPLNNNKIYDCILEHFKAGRSNVVAAEWAGDRAREFLAQAELCAAAGLHEESALLARDALRRAGSAYAARHGQGNLSQKYLMSKLQRCSGDAKIKERFKFQLPLQPPLPPDANARLHGIRDTMDVAGCEPIHIGEVAYRPADGLRSIELWGDVILSTARGSWFIATEFQEAAKALRNAGWIGTAGDCDDRASILLKALVRHGLVQLFHAETGIAYAPAEAYMARASSVSITSYGLKAGCDFGRNPSEILRFVQAPLLDLLSAGRAIGDNAWPIGNRQEDALGAIELGKWTEVNDAFEAIALLALRVAACSVGCHPLPEGYAVTEIALPERWSVTRSLAKDVLCNPVTDQRSALSSAVRVQAIIECITQTIVDPTIVIVHDSMRFVVDLIDCQKQWIAAFHMLGGSTSPSEIDAAIEHGDRPAPPSLMKLEAQAANAEWSRPSRDLVAAIYARDRAAGELLPSDCLPGLSPAQAR